MEKYSGSLGCYGSTKKRKLFLGFYDVNLVIILIIYNICPVNYVIKVRWCSLLQKKKKKKKKYWSFEIGVLCEVFWL